MGYCSKHAIIIANSSGIDEFWPHYHHSILEDIRYKEIEEEKERQRRLMKETLMNLDKDKRYHKKSRNK